ncbi:hypothetical protein L3X38_036112 [Prunus dulcis]|uniref:Uncharacterized protein n=1 Tax=Prunus dulcis TaxID=3755 RepID=A0AAD4YPB6_PRUDU|nr:hypothetical protein L3X38_036112 [Prunus dulcis]
MVTNIDEPILELEAHLSGAFEANNSKAKSNGPTKGLNDGPSKIEKSMKAEEKAEATADIEATEASENLEGTLAEDEELYGEE